MRVEPGNLGLNTVFSSSAPSPHSTGNCNLLKLCSRYTLFTSSLARNLSSKNEYNWFFYESSEICMKSFKPGKGGSGAQLQTDLSWKFSDTFFEAKLFQLSQTWVGGREGNVIAKFRHHLPMLREISVKNIPVWGNKIQSKGYKKVENPWCSSSRLQGEETVRDWNIDGHRLKPRLTSLELPFLSISFQILMNYYWRKYKYHLSKRLVTSET